MPRRCGAPVAVRILQPGEVRLVADESERERVRPRAYLACGIDHDGDVRADGFAHGADGPAFANDVSVVPAVDLEPGEAAVDAFAREPCVRLRAVESAARFLSV